MVVFYKKPAKSPSPDTDANNIPCVLTFLPNQKKSESFSRKNLYIEISKKKNQNVGT